MNGFVLRSWQLHKWDARNNDWSWHFFGCWEKEKKTKENKNQARLLSSGRSCEKWPRSWSGGGIFYYPDYWLKKVLNHNTTVSRMSVASFGYSYPCIASRISAYEVESESFPRNDYVTLNQLWGTLYPRFIGWLGTFYPRLVSGEPSDSETWPPWSSYISCLKRLFPL